MDEHTAHVNVLANTNSAIIKTDGETVEAVNIPHHITLTHREAMAGSPDDMAVCGEEDVGSALEFLVIREDG